MNKEKIRELQAQFVKFQSFVAGQNVHEGGYESQECEEIQNTIEILDAYASNDRS